MAFVRWGTAMGATSGAGSAYTSGPPDHPLVFSGVRVARSLVFYVVFSWSLFVIIRLIIVLSFLLRMTALGYFIGNFGLFILFFVYLTDHLYVDTICDEEFLTRIYYRTFKRCPLSVWRHAITMRRRWWRCFTRAYTRCCLRTVCHCLF